MKKNYKYALVFLCLAVLSACSFNTSVEKTPTSGNTPPTTMEKWVLYAGRGGRTRYRPVCGGQSV
jgi:hypothetical protein